MLAVVLFAVLWQSVAMACPGSTVHVVSDIAHAAIHWQDEGHHHRDDRTGTLDEPAASAQKLVADHFSTCAELVTAAGHAFPPSTPLLPHGLRKGPAPAPFLDGLLRPPRHRA